MTITRSLFIASLITQLPVRADDPLSPDARKDALNAVARALDYLAVSQQPDGGWSPDYGPAVAALITQAFVQDSEHGPDHPIVKRAVQYILRHEQPDGGIYDRKKNLANYQTSVSLTCLAALPSDSPYRTRIARAQSFLTKLQYDDAEKIESSDPWYGGAGYNEEKRPDLSNTQMMLEALHASGLPKSDPVYQRALKFVSRCQMLESSNDQKFAKGATDGGFIYTCAGGGESKADPDFLEGQTALRTYGSMTYAGFKSMLYANVSRDDPRIRACLKWIREHYTLDENPNMPGKRSHEGLYYYYHVFARALDEWGEPVLIDAGGTPHHWRLDLCRKLIALQRRDGSWVNDRDRWLEGDPHYVTALAVLSLQTALKPSPTGSDVGH